MVAFELNEYRIINGRQPVENWDQELNNHCLLHSLEMSRRVFVFHSEPHFRQDYSEAIASCSWDTNFQTSVRYLIRDVLGYSEEHRKIILDSNILGYGVHVDKGIVYMTIRGK